VARQHYSVSATTRQTTTATTAAPATAATLTFTPDANFDYFVFLFATYDQATVTRPFYAAVFDNGTGVFGFTETAFNAADRYPHWMLYRVAASASPVSHAITLRYASHASLGSGAGTVGISDVLLIAIKRDPLDQWTQGLGGSPTTTSATYATPATYSLGGVSTVTWTPATAGQYVIFTYSDPHSAGTGLDIKIRLWDGTTAYGEVSGWNHGTIATVQPPWNHVHLTGSLSGSQTWAVQYASATGAAVTIEDATILALRADVLPAVFANRVAVAGTTTSTTLGSFVSVTAAVNPASTLMCASAVLSQNGPIAHQQTEAGTNLSPTATESRRAGSTTATKASSVGYGNLKTPSAGGKAYDLQYRSTAAATSGIAEASVVLLQLDDTPRAGRPPSSVQSAAAGFLAAYLPGA
jgi:hypothetical protein